MHVLSMKEAQGNNIKKLFARSMELRNSKKGRIGANQIRMANLQSLATTLSDLSN